MAKYHCEHCNFEGECYGTPTSMGVSAPWCSRCGKNDRLIPLEEWRKNKEHVK